MPGEIRARRGALSDSGPVLTLVRSTQHRFSRPAVVDLHYFVLLKSWQGNFLISGLSLAENASDK